MKCILASLAALITMAAVSPSFALTAKDVTEKMSKQERFSYLTGLVDMLSYQSVLAGNNAHAKCIVDKFYGDKEVMRNVYAALDQHPDKAPEGLLILVMKQECEGGQ